MGNLISLTELADLLQIDIATLHRHMPQLPPSKKIGVARLWRTSDIEAIRQYFATKRPRSQEEHGLFNKRALARLCGVDPGRIERLIRGGVIPAPAHRKGRRLYYTRVQAEVLREMIKKRG